MTNTSLSPCFPKPRPFSNPRFHWLWFAITLQVSSEVLPQNALRITGIDTVPSVQIRYSVLHSDGSKVSVETSGTLFGSESWTPACAGQRVRLGPGEFSLDLAPAPGVHFYRLLLPTEPSTAEAETDLILQDLRCALDQGEFVAGASNAVQRLSSLEPVAAAEVSQDGSTMVVDFADGSYLCVGTVTADLGWAPGHANTVLRANSPPGPGVLPAPTPGSRPSRVSPVRLPAGPPGADIVPAERMALLFEPFYPALALPTSVVGSLNEAGYPVDIVRGSDCTLQRLISALNSGRYGVLILNSHGGVGASGKTFFALGEDYNPLDPAYLGLSPARREGIGSYVQLRGDTVITGAICHYAPSKCRKWAVDSRFIAANSSRLGDAIVWLGFCDSTVEPDLADAFISQGASGVLGFNDYLATEVHNGVAASFFRELALAQTSVGDAVLLTRAFT